MEHHHWTNPKGVCQHWSGLIIVESNLLLPNNPISTYNVAIKHPLGATSSLKAEADIEGTVFMERKRMSLVGVLGFGAELSIRGQASAYSYSKVRYVYRDTARAAPSANFHPHRHTNKANALDFSVTNWPLF